ncbi:hypothetical protein HAX54_035537 [Datura stramonium]|uniref:Uncharacterized protein n=1 Tax=Datura stramonium TaxID=4076 RepID=A0ABS8VGW1_DATST|nr:hypothetical protein [Datura stramonium]
MQGCKFPKNMVEAKLYSQEDRLMLEKAYTIWSMRKKNLRGGQSRVLRIMISASPNIETWSKSLGITYFIYLRLMPTTYLGSSLDLLSPKYDEVVGKEHSSMPLSLVNQSLIHTPKFYAVGYSTFKDLETSALKTTTSLKRAL